MTDLGKVVYDSFLHEAGFDKDARTVDFDKLASYHQERWRTIATNVIKAKEVNDEESVSAEYAKRVRAENAYSRKKETKDGKLHRPKRRSRNSRH
jgi:hypothetical protein